MSAVYEFSHSASFHQCAHQAVCSALAVQRVVTVLSLGALGSMPLEVERGLAGIPCQLRSWASVRAPE